MSEQTNEFEVKQNELALKQIAGKAQHIEINERTLEAYRKAFTDKGLVITSQEDYPNEEFSLVAQLKRFDALVDPSKGIRKVIESMVRQPVTVFNSKGVAETKDALYYNGNYYGVDKRGTEIGAEFREGSYKVPKLAFTYLDPSNPYDSRTGERRGEYRTSGNKTEHYIFLSEDKKERRKQLEDIVKNATGTSIATLSTSKKLSYRNPSPDNGHGAGHGGAFTFSQFCDLSIEELGEAQNMNYYKERSTGVLKDRNGQRVQYDSSTGKMDAVK